MMKDLTPGAEADPVKDDSAKEGTVVEKEETVEAKEASLGDTLGKGTTEPETTKKSDEPKYVPLATHLKTKKELKELKQQLKEAEEAALDDADVDDPDEKDVQPASSKLEERLSRIEQKERQEQLDKKFTKLYDDTLASHPEYKDLANADVIRQLAFNPANAGKTLTQVLEGVYGHLIQGRPSIERDIPANNPESGKVDIDKARKDPDYFKKVMADPKLKAEYNEGLHLRTGY